MRVNSEHLWEGQCELPRLQSHFPQLTFLGLAGYSIGPAGAAENAEYVSGSVVLTSLILPRRISSCSGTMVAKEEELLQPPGAFTSWRRQQASGELTVRMFNQRWDSLSWPVKRVTTIAPSGRLWGYLRWAHRNVSTLVRRVPSCKMANTPVTADARCHFNRFCSVVLLCPVLARSLSRQDHRRRRGGVPFSQLQQIHSPRIFKQNNSRSQ